MSARSTRPLELKQPGSRAPAFDIYIIIPVLACAYVEIIAPLLVYAETGPMIGGMWTESQLQIIMAPRLEHKIFWPALAVISAMLVAKNWNRLSFSPHIISLFAYLALAGVSVLWAYKPEFAIARFAQQAMVVITFALPLLLANRKSDAIHSLFLCFAAASIINVFFVLNQSPMIIETNVRLSYPGYFVFKSLLGQCAAIALLLSFYEILYRGWRRVFAIVIIGIAIYLVVLSDSKGSLAFALLAPILASITIYASRIMRVSPATVLLCVPVLYFILSKIDSNLINRFSWYLYGNYTLSGRTVIWDFANFEIARRPLLGWGYQSFWLVGPDAPSVVEAPGWVRGMPNAHNGYLDTMIDTGYVGFILFMFFIFMTLHAIGRMLEREPGRAWFLLTLALYVILTNFIESTWMHGIDMIWVLFLLVVAEAGRCWRPLPSGVSEKQAGLRAGGLRAGAGGR